MTVVGRTAGGAAVGKKSSAVLKVTSGTPSVIGAVTSLVDQLDVALTGAALAFVVSGSAVIVRVTGVLTQTIDWYGELRLLVGS